jgi:inner membrane protein
MDPLTHTLVGANLAATRLGSRCRFAATALVVGANFPDIDVLSGFVSEDFSRGFRRGWTHGLPAHAVLPFLLTGILLLLDRLRPDPKRRAVPRTLLWLSAIGIWTHPFLDWLNTYGMRWLMPFRGTWYYGDAVYIMDPWLWLILGGAWLAGRKPTLRLAIAFVVIGALLANTVAGRAPQYLPLLAGVAVALAVSLAAPLTALRGRLAVVALIIASLYIGGRIALNNLTEREVRQNLVAAGMTPQRMMVGPDPIDPLRWGFVAAVDGVYRFGTYHWVGGRFGLRDDRLEVARESPEWAAARQHPAIRGYVSWLRFPAYELEQTPAGTRVYIMDARRLSSGRRGFGTAVLVLGTDDDAIVE